MRSLNPLFLAMALALTATTGCSFSDSSGSLSDSISSPSESISDSSSSSSDDDSSDDDAAPETPEDTASYRQDISQLAVTYLKSGGELPALTSAIANLAQARGITDWEADSDTTQAIGMGAGTAGLDEAAFDDFAKQLFGEDLTKLNELRIGYQETASSTPAVAAPVAEEAPEQATDTASQPDAEPDA